VTSISNSAIKKQNLDHIVPFKGKEEKGKKKKPKKIREKKNEEKGSKRRRIKKARNCLFALTSLPIHI